MRQLFSGIGHQAAKDYKPWNKENSRGISHTYPSSLTKDTFPPMAWAVVQVQYVGYIVSRKQKIASGLADGTRICETYINKREKERRGPQKSVWGSPWVLSWRLVCMYRGETIRGLQESGFYKVGSKTEKLVVRIQREFRIIAHSE